MTAAELLQKAHAVEAEFASGDHQLRSKCNRLKWMVVDICVWNKW